MDLIKLTAVASDASEDLSLHVRGLIQKVRLVYSNNPGALSAVTLSAVEDGEGELIVNRPNSASNITLYPRRQVQDQAGNFLTLDGLRPLCEPYAVNGRLKLSLHQANPGGQCIAWVWLTR